MKDEERKDSRMMVRCLERASRSMIGTLYKHKGHERSKCGPKMIRSNFSQVEPEVLCETYK